MTANENSFPPDVLQAPPGARCLYCGRDVAGSVLRKCVYVTDPVPWHPSRIRYAGYGWVCGDYVRCRDMPGANHDTVFEKVPEGYGIVLREGGASNGHAGAAAR